jgi:hypothetical protein
LKGPEERSISEVRHPAIEIQSLADGLDASENETHTVDPEQNIALCSTGPLSDQLGRTRFSWGCRYILATEDADYQQHFLTVGVPRVQPGLDPLRSDDDDDDYD